MKANEQTLKQVERFVNKVSQKFPHTDEPEALTDIHVRVSPESGELLAFDDDDRELTRCVVEQWIECHDENFYEATATLLRRELQRLRKLAEGMGLLKPYAWVLETDEGESVGELLVADDDTVIVGGELLEGLDKDLDDFFKQLMKSE